MCVAGTHQVLRRRAEEEGVARVSRRRFLAAGAAAAVLLPAAPAWATPPPGRGSRERIRDLTHVFSTDFPVFTGDKARRETLFSFEEHGFYAQTWAFAEHTATHLDAPGHFAQGNRLADQLPPDELVRPAVVIDISERAAGNPNATVAVADLVAFERSWGRIPRRSVVCMYSGWEEKLAEGDEAFRGSRSFPFNFPGFSIEAVEWLVERRDIQGIGVDTLSLDPGNSLEFPVHFFLLGEERYGIENLANLATIPPRGTEMFVGLIPWEQGSGGPCRVIARW